jgi:murein DD-endopeptidase MepM/ murein hydrolase activator NlpD
MRVFKRRNWPRFIFFALAGSLQSVWSLAEPGVTHPGLELNGPIQQGAVVVGRAPPGARILQDDREILVSTDGVFLLGFDRDAPPHSELRIVHPDGQEQQLPLNVKQRTYQVQRIDGLPPRKVTPSKSDLKRIQHDAELVREARSLIDTRTDFLRGFQWPATGRISGVYGSQRILNGKPKRPHYGVDIAGPIGTLVRSPAPGTVTLAQADMFYSGGTLIIDHGHGLSSSFLHLSRILVTEGQRVDQGELIAEIGATGRVTGAHLDWRMNLLDARVDPQLLVGPMPE